MRECILQPGIKLENLPVQHRTLYLSSITDIKRLTLVYDDRRYDVRWRKTDDIMEIYRSYDSCYRVHKSLMMWCGIPQAEFEVLLRKKLSELVRLVHLANYPSGYLSICVRNEGKEFIGYTANNTYYGEDSKYPIDIHSLMWEDEEGIHQSYK